MNITYIFDFDGTIADSFKFIAEFMRTRLGAWGAKKNLNINNLDELRSLSYTEIFNYFDIPLRKLPFILYEVRKEMRYNISHIKPVHKILDVLTALKNNGDTLLILTSNSVENVENFLSNHQFDHVIDKVYSEKSFFSKCSKLEKIIRHNKLNLSKTVYIGDEIRDITAARSNQIKSIAVSWGFQTETILIKHCPDVLIKCPSEILSLGTKDFFL